MSISAVYAWPLPEATSTTVVIEICTACGQPAVDDLYRQTRNKLPCVLQLQSQFHVTDTVTLHPSKSPSIASFTHRDSECTSSIQDPWAFWASTCANLKYTCIYLCIRSFNLNFRYMATRKHTNTRTYTRDSQCNHASVGLAQARPN